MLQQILNQTGGQIPQPGQQLNLNVTVCDCCDQPRAALPYTHTDPSGFTWSYCQQCYDAGCSGPNGYCELELEDEELGDCVVCQRRQQLATNGDHPWCAECFEKYTTYLQTHPIPPKDRFTPIYRGEKQVMAHMPAYMYPPAEWDKANFKPEYILNPASAPPPTRKKAHIVSQQQSESTEEMMRRLIAEQLGGAAPASSGGDSIDDVLAAIDPRDSDTALKLFHWLRDNARMHKVASLEQGGYLFLYQEPKGSSNEGYVVGGTQGDRIVDEALEKAQASGGKPLKGLCKKCFSPIAQVGDGKPEAESPRPGTDPTECSGGGLHEFAA